MKNQRIQYTLISFFLSISLLFCYITFLVKGRVENLLIFFNFNELEFKILITIPLFIGAFFYKTISKKEVKIKPLFIFGIISFLFFLIPYSSYYRIPTLGIIINVVSFFTLLRCAIGIATYYHSSELKKDQFNKKNQSFPQEKKIKEAIYSINISHQYYDKGKWNKGWVNIVNVFRTVFIYGIMGSGKSFTFFLQGIYQLMRKKFTMVIYDYKFPDLTKEVYKFYKALNPKASLYFLCFSDIKQSHKCNPIEPKYIPDITDIEIVSDTIIKNIAKEDSGKYDPFFDGSAQGILTALIALCKKMEKKYDMKVCSIPHALIMASVKIDYLLPILLNDKETLMHVTSLRDAFVKEDAAAQLAGQTGSLTNKVRKLFSNEVMYILSGKSDFDLELNNPSDPKILCIGSDQKKANVMSPVVSLFFEIIAKQTNVAEKSKVPFMMFIDEFPRLFFKSIEEYLASGRSNLCGLFVGSQGTAQLKEKQSEKVAKAILDIQGTVICGLAGNETARYFQERIGKTNQEKTNVTINEGNYSTTHSTTSDYLVPISRITTFSQGEFTGIVTDEIKNEIEQKVFLGKMDVDEKVLDIVDQDDKMPNINTFESAKSDNLIQEHLNQIKSYNLIPKITSIFNIEDYDIQCISDSNLKFYFKFLKMDTKFIANSRFNKKDPSIAFNREEIELIITDLIKKRILENEEKLFLDKYMDKLYKEVEYCIKKEYFEVTGEKIESSLFNITDGYDYVIENQEAF